MLKQLGTGSMARVYEAWDRKLERRVALKFLDLDPSALGHDGQDQILLEARAAARLDHPNIASIYDVVSIEGKPCLVMQHVDGTNLAELRGAPPLPFAELFGIAIAIARGLAEAHGKGIIHRDIKPKNIMRTRTGEIKIVDFGLARIISDETLKTLVTSHVSGTPAYMSPEVLRSARPDTRSDIFSTGILYYEICIGRYPFRSENFKSLFRDLIYTELPPLDRVNAEVPSWFSQIVRRMTAKDKKARFRDGVELLQALEQREFSARDDSTVIFSARNLGQSHWLSAKLEAVRSWWRRQKLSG